MLEALSKPPYEPLREASFKNLTLKTVFLLAMASAGRRSELQALRFDQNYIRFKPKGAGVTLYFSPEFMRKNQKPNQVNDPWYIRPRELHSSARELRVVVSGGREIITYM